MEVFDQSKNAITPVGDFINPTTGDVEFTSSDIQGNEEVKKYIDGQIGDNIDDKIDYVGDTEAQEIVDSASSIPQVPGQIVMPGFAEGSQDPTPDEIEGQKPEQAPAIDEGQLTMPEPDVKGSVAAESPANPETTDAEPPQKSYKYKSSEFESEAEKTGQSYLTVLRERGINPDDVDPDK